MKTATWLLACGFIGVSAAQADAPATGLAVVVDPVHHPVIFENDHVRVFEALASPGARSPMHAHPPMVLVSMDRARLRMTPRGGPAQILDLYPGQVAWIGGAEHQWQLLSGRIEVAGVELKPAALAGKAGAPLPADDAVTADSDHHQVLLENDHVRVISALASPGARSPQHSHAPMVLVSLGPARLRMQNADGDEGIVTLRRGQVLWRPEVRHSWEMLSGQAEVVAVEIKAARATPAGN